MSTATAVVGRGSTTSEPLEGPAMRATAGAVPCEIVLDSEELVAELPAGPGVELLRAFTTSNALLTMAMYSAEGSESFTVPTSGADVAEFFDSRAGAKHHRENESGNGN